MAIVFTNDEHYGDIADAIRLKNGTQTTYRPDEMAAAIEAIPGGLTPTGTIQITQNGNYNVTNFAEAAVSVPGVIPAGVKSITADGTYDVTTYATANVNTKPAKGLVFGDYDSDGYPHTAEFVGTWTKIPSYYCYFMSANANSLAGKITSLKIPDTVTSISQSAFWGWQSIEEFDMPDSDLLLGHTVFNSNMALQTVELKRNVTFSGNGQFSGCRNISSVTFGADVFGGINAFVNCTSVMLYDFSNATSVPTLSAVSSLGHASGCVIRIPLELSDTTLGEGNGWESATNWVGLTNVTWQGV